MDRIGRFTVILVTLLLLGFEPWVSRAQSPNPAATPIPPPRPVADFDGVARRSLPPSRRRSLA